MAKDERSGFRDALISLIHRQWGPSLGATDIDFRLIEWVKRSNQIKVCAIVEYKHVEWVNLACKRSECHKFRDVILSEDGLQATAQLCDMAGIPGFLVIYDNQLKSFNVWSLNEEASKFFDSQKMSEEAYVTLLYKIRGKDLRGFDGVPQEVLERIRSGETRSNTYERYQALFGKLPSGVPRLRGYF